jgi:hypothetical protein
MGTSQAKLGTILSKAAVKVIELIILIFFKLYYNI